MSVFKNFSSKKIGIFAQNLRILRKTLQFFGVTQGILANITELRQKLKELRHKLNLPENVFPCYGAMCKTTSLQKSLSTVVAKKDELTPPPPLPLPTKKRTNPAAELAKSATTGAAQPATCCKSDNVVSKVVVMYGTTTGNSEDFAGQKCFPPCVK